MTEASFQACRKIMQKANYLRGIITKWEGEVAKWTRIEGSHRENLRAGQAEGAQKMIEKSLIRLKEVREKFAALQFPEPNLKEVVTRCDECKRKTNECICYE